MEYRIQSGDSLSKIAQANHTTVAQIKADNPQAAAAGFHVGDSIKVSAGSAPVDPNSGLMEYPLQPGETLSSVADKLLHDSSRWGEIASMNQGILGEVANGSAQLQAGDKLMVRVPAQPQPQPANVADTQGITGKGTTIKQEQTDLNTWLNTNDGKAWAATPAGQSAVGSTGGQLEVDGLEGPLTRAVKSARDNANAQGVSPASVNGADQTTADAMHTQRVALLQRMAANGAPPEVRARVAAALVRDDMHARRPIDGGTQGAYQWRDLMNDKPGATALANDLSVGELKSLKKWQPEYFQALDTRSGGTASLRLIQPTANGLGKATPYQTHTAELQTLAKAGGSAQQKAVIAARLVHDDMRNQRPIDGGASNSAHTWRSLMNDQPSAAALANTLSVSDLTVLSIKQPEYFQALNTRSGGVAQQRIDANSEWV